MTELLAVVEDLDQIIGLVCCGAAYTEYGLVFKLQKLDLAVLVSPRLATAISWITWEIATAAEKLIGQS